MYPHAKFVKHSVRIRGIFSPCHHIRVKIVLIVFLKDALHHILRFTSQRICSKSGNHATHLRTRQNLMRGFYCQGIRQKLVVCTLENGIHIIRFLILDQTAAIIRVKAGAVYLIKRKPIIHQISQITEQRFCIVDIEIYHFPVFPSAVPQQKLYRRVIVQDRCKHFHSTRVAFPEQIAIKLNSFFVRFRLISIRENSRPADRCPEHLKSQFLHQAKILFVLMIKINSEAKRIMRFLLRSQGFFKHGRSHIGIPVFCPCIFVPQRIKIAQVLRADSLSPFLPCAVCLRSRNGPSP